MKISLVLALLSCVCGLGAAFFWYRSSQIPVMPTWMTGDRPDPLNEPVIKSLSQDGWIAGTVQAVQESARWNKLGAGWSAAAVLLTALSSLTASLESAT